MGPILAIIQLVAATLLLAVALSVRFAGNAEPLNGVDYARVIDRAALHRWAGTRLLLVPGALLAGGLASLRSPGLALLFLGAAMVVCLYAAVWVALGAEKFQRAA